MDLVQFVKMDRTWRMGNAGLVKLLVTQKIAQSATVGTNNVPNVMTHMF